MQASYRDRDSGVLVASTTMFINLIVGTCMWEQGERGGGREWAGRERSGRGGRERPQTDKGGGSKEGGRPRGLWEGGREGEADTREEEV